MAARAGGCCRRGGSRQAAAGSHRARPSLRARRRATSSPLSPFSAWGLEPAFTREARGCWWRGAPRRGVGAGGREPRPLRPGCSPVAGGRGEADEARPPGRASAGGSARPGTASPPRRRPPPPPSRPSRVGAAAMAAGPAALSRPRRCRAGSALPFAQRGRSQAAGGGRVTPLHNEPPRQGEITPGLPFRRAAPTHPAWGRAPGLCRGRREHGDVRPVSPALGGLKGRSFPQEKVPVARPVPMSRAGRQAGRLAPTRERSCEHTGEWGSPHGQGSWLGGFGPCCQGYSVR